MNYEWSRLTPLQLGRLAEYFAKMEFAAAGFDVYSAEVDDKGIDFVIRKDAQRYYDIQVKSVRGLTYIFLSKDKFQPTPNSFASIVIFMEGEAPKFFLVPSMAWLQPNALLCDRNYEGLQSKPEWGLNLSKKNLPLLEPYRFQESIQQL